MEPLPALASPDEMAAEVSRLRAEVAELKAKLAAAEARLDLNVLDEEPESSSEAASDAVSDDVDAKDSDEHSLFVPTGLSDMPPEILHMITKFLPRKGWKRHVMNLAMCSKYLFEVLFPAVIAKVQTDEVCRVNALSHLSTMDQDRLACVKDLSLFSGELLNAISLSLLERCPKLVSLSIDVDSKETFESMRTCFKHAKGTLENLTVNAVDLRLIYSFPYDFDLPHLKTVTLKGIGSNEIPNAVIRGSPKLKSAVCSYSYPSRGLQWDMGRLDRRFVSKIKSSSSDRRSDMWSILQFENFTPEKIYDRCRNTFSVNFFSPDMWEKIVQMENLKVLELAEVSTSYFVGGIPKPSERLELAAVRLSCLEPGELVTAPQNIRQAGCKVSFRAKLPDHSMSVVDDEIILLAQEHDFWTAQKDIDYRGYENSPDEMDYFKQRRSEAEWMDNEFL